MKACGSRTSAASPTARRPGTCCTSIRDYKIVFVGDASMSPYEIMVPGGSVEHVNEEPGSVWLDRIIRTYPHAVWLNPVAQKHWDYSESTTIIKRIFANRMYPITIEGLEGAMKELTH